jgi:hypothetical protein
MANTVPGLRKENDEVRGLLQQMIDQFQRADALIQFIGEPFAPEAGALEAAVPVEVTDAVAVRNSFSAVRSVQVDITGGTATGAQIKDGDNLSPVDGSLKIPLPDGQRIITIIATSTGTVDLALTDVSGTGLDVTDTATVTFS